MKVHMGGFKPLKDGKIHLRCSLCGRYSSNRPRVADAPITAVLLEFECSRHNTYSADRMFFDEHGNEIKVNV